MCFCTDKYKLHIKRESTRKNTMWLLFDWIVHFRKKMRSLHVWMQMENKMSRCTVGKVCYPTFVPLTVDGEQTRHTVRLFVQIEIRSLSLPWFQNCKTHFPLHKSATWSDGRLISGSGGNRLIINIEPFGGLREDISAFRWILALKNKRFKKWDTFAFNYIFQTVAYTMTKDCTYILL